MNATGAVAAFFVWRVVEHWGFVERWAERWRERLLGRMPESAEDRAAE
jgi:hypothetical protein